MRCCVAGLGFLLLVGCDVERDLDAQNFSCANGGSCSTTDGGTMDGGGTRDGGPTTPVTCDPRWGIGDACGGDLVGQWTVDEICGVGFFEATLQDLCPGILVQRADSTGTGLVTFTSANMYDVSMAVQVDTDFTIPALCRTALTCQLVCTYLDQFGGTTTCVDNAAGGCDGNYVGAFPVSLDGDYTVAGPIVTIEDGVDQIPLPYCVEGNRLTYSLRGTTFVTQRR